MTLTLTCTLTSLDETNALGALVAAYLQAGDVLLLKGTLGAGKTTFARSVIKATTGAAEAPSPTFTLVEIYEGTALTLWHFDLYRLEDPAEIWELGIEDALIDGVSLIEWPEKGPPIFPQSALVISLSPQKSGNRLATISIPDSVAARFAPFAAAMKNQFKASA